MKDKILISIGVILAVVIGTLGVEEIKRNFDEKPVDIKKEEKPINKDINYTSDFNINLIKTVDKEENYLISPYSINIALNMLKEGADNNTLKEIENVLGNNKVTNITSDDVKIANALFVKNQYKDKIKKEFYNNIKTNYNGEILYDDFKTPNVINNWVNKNTDRMISKILDRMDPNFVLGLANAIAIDVKWQNSFECINTTKEKFKLKDKELDVEMMHNSYKYGAKYIKSNEAEGIIIPYQSTNKIGEKDYDENNYLEFIGILPNSDIKAYINNLTKEQLNNLLSNTKESSNKLEINLSLPRFKYEYDLIDFKQVLIKMGMKDAFDPNNADFTKIIDRGNGVENIYVDEAIHKTYIDLNEKGTKAAAVTYFGVKDNAAMLEEDKETINIEFNKPFIYMIIDHKTNEILFFGTVYEPNAWKGSTCSK